MACRLSIDIRAALGDVPVGVSPSRPNSAAGLFLFSDPLLGQFSLHKYKMMMMM